MSLRKSLGTVPWSVAALANAALFAQFPLAHPLLLAGPNGWAGSTAKSTGRAKHRSAMTARYACQARNEVLLGSF
ncbi:hypothetical protein [Marivivens donghaensis]|uniref:hypothetical protein n=1 Tax=Marivivens donghaensis TaxID=1699413 RepID=UPI003F69ACB1